MKKLIIAAIGAALLSGNAMADLSWKDYKKYAAQAAQGNKMIEVNLDSYIAGAISALFATNLLMKNEKQPQVYCEPAKLSLNPANVKALLANEKSPEIARMPPEMPLGMAIMFALRDAFPCQ